MSTTGRQNGAQAKLTEQIRRQIGKEPNRRHLARLPAFSLPSDMPERLDMLLAELDSAERGASRQEMRESAQSGHHWPASAHGRSRE